MLGDVRVAFDDVPDDARECETVYRETADGLSPLFKRWCVAPAGSATLFNHADWFDAPLDSLGAARGRGADISPDESRRRRGRDVDIP